MHSDEYISCLLHAQPGCQSCLLLPFSTLISFQTPCCSLSCCFITSTWLGVIKPYNLSTSTSCRDSWKDLVISPSALLPARSVWQPDTIPSYHQFKGQHSPGKCQQTSISAPFLSPVSAKHKRARQISWNMYETFFWQTLQKSRL